MTPADVVALRARLGWTQQQLADAIGMHVNTVACMERGVKPITPRTVAVLELVERVV